MSDGFWQVFTCGVLLGVFIGTQIGVFVAERKHKVPKEKRYWW